MALNPNLILHQARSLEHISQPLIVPNPASPLSDYTLRKRICTSSRKPEGRATLFLKPPLIVRLPRNCALCGRLIFAVFRCVQREDEGKILCGLLQAILLNTVGNSGNYSHGSQSLSNKTQSTPWYSSKEMVLSDDSAERDHLIEAGLSLGAKLPLRSAKHHHSHKRAHLDFVEDDPPAGEELTAGGAGPDQPGNPLSDDVITVEFHSPAPDIVPSDISLDWPKAPQPQKQKAGDPTAWTLSDFYDYLSPDDDLSALDTTPEPEPTPSPPPDMEDENPLLSGSPAIPKSVKPNPDSGPSLPAPPMAGQDRADELGLGGAMGPDGCRLGFVLSGPGVCVSQCDLEPNFCLNGGVCTVVAGMGAFCRCNVQDYIWNKGTRCDWAVTEFQVLCVVVGVSSFVLLLLFMIIVFFAKRLYRLKNENRRLRKRSKYRPQSSEPQTDGLSVSTTADGSQPNVRKLCDTPPPDEPQKHDDPAKSLQPKEDGSMNILNSHSPKHENNRPHSAIHDHGHTPNNTEENAEVNMLQNNLV
uniref:Chondroitin sulfate proteoglycan 5b n=1 Tax=Salarias fasciatus TaxID=181472 RepID=A0A672IUM3_SALFA